MPKRNPGRPVFLILLALAGVDCGMPSVADAADLAIPQRSRSHAAAPGVQAATACCSDRTSTIITRSNNLWVEADGAKNARAAQALFLDLRAAMEREMELRHVLSKDELEALEGDMKRLSAQLRIRAQSGHLPSPSKARDALNLAQDWYQTSLGVIIPPAGGVTELPLPMDVSDKADRVAMALEQALEEATTYASERQTIGLPKKRGVNGLRPVTSHISQIPNDDFR
jgi:hypothetical protein